MIERRLACFPPGNEAQPRLGAALAALTGLESFADVGSLSEAIRTGRVDATVVFVDVKTFDLAESTLRRIRATFPSHPLVAYYNPRGLSPRHLVTIAQSGITELVHLDVDDSRITFNRILNNASRVTYADTLFGLLKGDVPEPLHSVFVFSLQHAGRRLDVDELAASLGLSKRTLSWRMAQYRAPSPRMFLTWSRLLVAALLLDDHSRTLDSVSDQLNFTGGHALGAVFFRYMDRGIITLRNEGVLEQVLAAFRLAMKGSPEDPPGSLPARIRRG